MINELLMGAGLLHNSRSVQLFGTLVPRVETSDSLVALTFDDGPTPGFTEHVVHFRAPYGKRLVVLPWELWRSGRVHVMWDVEPESYPDIARDSARIVAHVLERIRPGSIILLHPFFESRRASIRAIPAVIDGLRARRYRFVTVSELIGAGRSARSVSSAGLP